MANHEIKSRIRQKLNEMGDLNNLTETEKRVLLLALFDDGHVVNVTGRADSVVVEIEYSSHAQQVSNRYWLLSLQLSTMQWDIQPK